MPEMPIKHHEFSPSKLVKFAVCPWSYKNCIGWTSPSGEDAQRGTLMHRAIYDDAAMEELNERDRETILSIREKWISPMEGKGVTHYHELYVEVRNVENTVITAGFIDDLIVSPDGKNGSLIDHKFGNHPVPEAERNPQMWGYVVGAFQKLPKLESLFAYINQPIFEADYDKQKEYTREDVPGLIEKIEFIVSAAKDATENDAVVNYLCRYCNREHCPAYRSKMNANLAVLALNEEGKVLSEEDRDMTLDFADRLLCAKRDIESLMDEKCENAKKAVLAAGGSANFKVMAGRTTRRTDWKKLSAEKGITDEEIAQYTTESVGEPYLAAKMRRAKMIVKGDKK